MSEAVETVFIIDDDASVRKSLSRLLRSHGFAVEPFGSGEQFLEREPFQGVGCIVLDLRMPGLGGMDLQDQLGKTGYGMPIVFISGYGDVPTSVQAMRKGAVHFLPKPFDDEELLQAVKEAIEVDRKTQGKRTEREDIHRRLNLLTSREREILGYVITGMLNKQIASRHDISEKTVKVHRGRVMEKLCVDSVADLVRLTEKAGIEPSKE